MKKLQRFESLNTVTTHYQTFNITSKHLKMTKCYKNFQWGVFYLFIADFFATQILGGAKELVVL